MKEFDVRWALQTDVADIFALEQEAFATDRISLRSWRRLMDSASAAVIVATSGNQIIGSAVILSRKKSLVSRIYSIAVKAGFQRAGVGRCLITHACLIAHRRRHREVRLESRINNLKAHGLFHSLGFIPWGNPVNGYYADGSAACRFRLTLPTAA